jgi:Na+/serine symporter
MKKFLESLEEYWFVMCVCFGSVLLLLLLFISVIYIFIHRNDPKPIVRYFITTPMTNHVAKEVYYQSSDNQISIDLEDGRNIQIAGTYSIEKKVIGYTKK